MSDYLKFGDQCRIDAKRAVYGYIRENIHDGINIPADIMNICVKFYSFFRDEFDQNSIGPHHKSNGMIIRHNPFQDKKSSVSILKNAISDGIYCWKFRMIEPGAIMIGVCREDLCHLVRDKPFAKDGKGYALTVTGGANYALDDQNHDTRMKATYLDIVTMRLDFDTLTIWYRLNDEDPIVVFKNIIRAPYKAAVYTYRGRDCVELLATGTPRKQR